MIPDGPYSVEPGDGARVFSAVATATIRPGVDATGTMETEISATTLPPSLLQVLRGYPIVTAGVSAPLRPPRTQPVAAAAGE